MKKIQELRNRIPDGSLSYIDTKLGEEIEIYARRQLGDEVYNKILEEGSLENEATQIETITQDFQAGFFYAIDFFNLYVPTDDSVIKELLKNIQNN